MSQTLKRGVPLKIAPKPAFQQDRNSHYVWMQRVSASGDGSGAVGFLLKDAPPDQLAIAIRRVMAGERVVDPDLALSVLSDGNNPLTRRERDVLRASSDSVSVADIAALLYLSEGTVRNHISTAIQKLNVHNRMEAAHLARERGWL